MMKDRLIELIHDSGLSLDSVRIAEHLLENGVIVPPCKVGEKVYVLIETSCEDIDGAYTTCEFYQTNNENLCALSNRKCPYIYRIEGCLVTDINLLSFSARWNKTVFPTIKEAEKTLKQLKKN